MGKMKVMIAYDGSDCARDALDDLQRAGLPRDAAALIVTVSDAWVTHAPSGSEAAVLSDAEEQGSQALEEARQLAEEAGRRVRADFPGWEVRAAAAAGSPARELTVKADRWRADLVVVGSRGRSSLGRLLLGSVSRKVVHDAKCSVRVVRRAVEGGDSPLKIIVGTDGSSGAADAVRAVAARRWPGGSEVRLVTSLRSAHADAAAAAAQLAQVQGIHQTDLERLLRAGVAVSHVIRTGEAKDALAEEAESWEAECIFVGSRGLGDGLTRYLLGSVSDALVRDAPCSVEVVRPQVEAA